MGAWLGSHRNYFYFILFLSHCVAQVDLKLMIPLPQPPDAGITGMHHHARVGTYFSIKGKFHLG
jgi:hypothetical protein